MNTLYRKQVLALLCDIDNHDEMAAALDILLTDKEQQDVDQRLQIFHMLETQVPQREISTKLGVGIATVTRGAKAMRTDSYKTIAQLLRSVIQR
ncbi:MAG: Trp family transcriptional regulator [Oceanospirillaceae bacterium]|jgi:Trp operon repressor